MENSSNIKSSAPKKRKSFTVVEIVVVLFIVAVLTCVAIFYGVSIFPSPFRYGQTVQFDAENSIKIDIPIGLVTRFGKVDYKPWKIRQEPGTPFPGLAKTYDMQLTALGGVDEVLTITVGKSTTRKSLTEQEFGALGEQIAASILPNSVETKAEFQQIEVRGGRAMYCGFTDASLVDRDPKQGEYKYLVLYLANYDDGCFVYATALSDSPYTDEYSFWQMLQSLASIEPLLAMPAEETTETLEKSASTSTENQQ